MKKNARVYIQKINHKVYNKLWVRTFTLYADIVGFSVWSWAVKLVNLRSRQNNSWVILFIGNPKREHRSLMNSKINPCLILIFRWHVTILNAASELKILALYCSLAQASWFKYIIYCPIKWAVHHWIWLIESPNNSYTGQRHLRYIFAVKSF